MITGYMESSLTQSEVFLGLNDNLDITSKAKELILHAKKLTNEDIEAAYITVKQITDSLTRAALKAFDSQKIILLYNNEPSLAMTQAIPFLTFRTKRGHITYVFVDKYITLTKDGILKIEPSVFRDLIISATVANGIKANYENLSTNQYLSEILMGMYTKFFTRIINREFSVAADKVIFDTIKYWINKYFLINVFGTTDTPENIENLATEHVKYLDETQVQQMKNSYSEAGVSKLSDLLALMSDYSSRMKDLNLGVFLNNWVNYYYAPSMLAADNIEYLIFMTLCMLSGNGSIVNVAASDVVKEAKNIKSYRGELLKLIS